MWRIDNVLPYREFNSDPLDRPVASIDIYCVSVTFKNLLKSSLYFYTIKSVSVFHDFSVTLYYVTFGIAVEFQSN
jgi:hypothetical protein